MRLSVVMLVVLSALVARPAHAQTTGASTVVVSHLTLVAGQAETVTVLAHDLAGQPLPGATVTIVVHFGGHSTTYHPRATDQTGRTSQAFHAPAGAASGKVPILVTISNGYLRQTLATRFAFKAGGPATSSTATPASTATPSPRTTATSSGLEVIARALPLSVVAPNPVYVVVNVRSQNHDQPNVAVSVTASFKEGKVVTHGITDAYGVATVRIDTTRARSNEVVKVTASSKWKGVAGSGATVFAVSAAHQTVTPTVADTSGPVAPTFVPTATSTPVTTASPPTPTVTPDPLPTGTPTPTDYPTPTPYPTATPYPTSTPYPTYTPVPTATPVPTVTPTPLPTNTPTPTPECPGSQTGCMQAMLNIINQTRSQYGLYPLVLNTVQSNGTSTCVGSYGHSQAMAESGNIWHSNPSYPAASFPNNICVSTSSAAENVGQFSSGNELNDLQQIHNLMMNEPHDAATCASQINHACNILTTSFHQVGIGIYFAANRTWLTEDFVS